MKLLGKERLVLLVSAILSSHLAISSAVAADVASPMPTKAIVRPAPILNPWTFSFTPYAWVTLLNGSTTVKGRTADVNVTYSDIWDLVEHSEIPKDLFQFAGYFEARNGRLSLFADVIYEKIGVGAGMTRTVGTDELGAAVGASAGLKYQMVIAEMAAAYEIVHWGSTGAPGSGTAIDVLGGARGWWQTADASLSASGTINIGDLTRNADGTLTASGSASWVDPLVGLRLRHQFAPGWNFVATGDVGGFGVGSKFSWQALAALNYDFYVHNGITWSGMAGYRALYVDYSKGSGLSEYEFNMTIYGPVIGLTARF